MAELGGEEHCNRCGAVVYPFSSREAMSDHHRYCIRCAEELDARYILKNSCSLCGRLMSKREVKFVLPSMAYGESQMPVNDRLACTTCYRKTLRRSRARLIRTGAQRARGEMRKQITEQLMQNGK